MIKNNNFGNTSLPEGGIIKIFGVKIHNITLNEILKKIDKYIKTKQFHIIFTPNVDDIIKASKDNKFLNVLNSADLNIPDGMGVVIGSYLLGSPFREMVGGRRLVPIICGMGASKKWRIYLFGSKNNVANLAKDALEKKFPGVYVVGAYSPSVNIMTDADECSRILQDINHKSIDILFVGLGSPKGKKWIFQNKEKLQVSIAIEVGGTFDILAGVRKEPPLWMTNIGLEWLYRLFEQPSYVWKRYLIQDPKFFWWILRKKIIRKGFK